MIIDARGRRAWGDIRIDRGILTISVPEGWLGEAKYPVTVDPVIGSSTLGAYNVFDYLSQDDYEYYLEEKEEDPSVQLDSYILKNRIQFMQHAILNKYETPAQLQGTYNVYVYMERIELPSKYYTRDYDVIPLLFSDYNNKPKYLLNYDSTLGNPMAGLSDANNFTPRWVQSTMTTNGAVAENTNVWFGYYGDNGWLRFDYGVPLLQTYDINIDYHYRKSYSSLYEMAVSCDFLNLAICTDMNEGPYAVSNPNILPGARYDFKITMCLGIPASYARTLYQGAALTDSRKLAGSYKRSAAQTARGTAEATRFVGFCRSVVQAVNNFATAKGPLALARKLTQQTRAGAVFGRLLSLIRNPTQTAGAGDVTQRITQAKRSMADIGKPGTALGRALGLWRSIAHTEKAEDALGHGADYLRGLFVESGAIAETTRRGEYKRKQQDMAHSETVSLRHLFVFIRLLTGSYIRDYIIGRFLKSKEEVVIKSAVCRELRIDSTLH
jgi:hypothetical protein